MDLSGRALNLAIAEYMGDVELVNTELELFRKVTPEDIRKQAAEIFRKTNCSTLYYLSNRKN
jgi:zinc protease